MKESKKKIILIVLALISIVAITIGITYAFFNYAKEGTTDNTITAGTIEFLYTENPIAGRGIALTDAMPMSDSDGIRLSGEGNEFNFTITSKTASKIAIPYEITARRELETNNEDNLDPSVVRIYLAKVETGLEDEQVLLDYFDKLGTPGKTGLDTTVERLLYTGRVPSSTPNYEQHFKLKMWIDSKTEFSAEKNLDGSYKTDGDGNLIYPYNNKKFTIKVNVYSHGDVLTDIEAANEINTGIKDIYLGNKEDDVKFTKVEGQTYQYKTTLPSKTTETTINIEPENKDAKVKIEKLNSLAMNELPKVERLSKKETIDLVDGDNYFKITITSASGRKTDYYIVDIYVLPSVKIIFDSNGGSVSIDYLEIKEDGTYDSLPTPLRSGYTFHGWYTAKNGGNVINDSNSSSVTTTQTVYARWGNQQYEYSDTVNPICTVYGRDYYKANNTVAIVGCTHAKGYYNPLGAFPILVSTNVNAVSYIAMDMTFPSDNLKITYDNVVYNISAQKVMFAPASYIRCDNAHVPIITSYEDAVEYANGSLARQGEAKKLLDLYFGK